MVTQFRSRSLLSVLLAATLGLQSSAAVAQTRTTLPVGDIGNGASLLPTGQVVTPTAAPGSTFSVLSTGLRSDGNADANGAVLSTLSPDGKTLLVVTSGYNLNFNNETTGEPLTYPVLDPATGQPTTTTTPKAEWVFVFDVSSGTPVKQQQLNIPNTYNGLVWAPDGQRFYVSAGIDDRIYVYKFDGSQFVPDAPFILLGHNSDQSAPFPTYDGGLLKGTPAALASTGAAVAGLGISKDGKTLVAANFENDSISIIDTQTRAVLREIKFFTPGSTVPTGEFPYDVAVYSNGSGVATKAFVTSQRDDEVLAVDLATDTVTRIPTGSQPNRLALSPDQKRLYVVNGNSDSLTAIDPVTNNVVRTISLARPGYKYRGSNPNAIAFRPKSTEIYVTLGAENAVAVVDALSGRVKGRIPTGWYPNSATANADGSKLFVVNAKDNIGPNPSNGRTTDAGEATNTTFKNEYTWALEKAGIATIPVPNASTLAALSLKVDRNNGFGNQKPAPLMAYLRTKIKHVIYIVKENRTYDQILGDLPVGNGDPSLALFPQAVSPNHHALASDFVTLDNFYDPGESSGVGWNWSTYARTTDFTEKNQSVLYGNADFAGITYDYEGTNRNINPALPQTSASPNPLNTRVTGLLDPTGASSILPGPKDISAPEGDGNLEPDAIGGYLWDAALRGGKTVRNYGFFIDLAYYGTSETDPTQPDPANPLYIPISRTPFTANLPQSPVTKTVLLDKTDIYFRGYDNKGPDLYRYEEWLREFNGYVTNNNLPNLSLVRIMHDHFGSFSNAVGGLDTAEEQMADDDYALGKIVESVSKSIYWKDTAIVIVEDDSQDGPDHVDGHRSVGYILSPYTKRGAVVSTNYNTVNLLRTIEDLLGIDYLGLLDANARPMSDVFTRTPNYNTYTATIPGILCDASQVDPALVPDCASTSAARTLAVRSRHDGKWWAQATKGFNFAVEDRLDPEAFNRVLWKGIKGETSPYPDGRTRKDLRKQRARLLKRLADANSTH